MCLLGKKKVNMGRVYKNVKIRDNTWSQQPIVGRIRQNQGFPNSSFYFFLRLGATDLHGRRRNHSSSNLSHPGCQDLPFHWGDHSLTALYSKFGLFADAGPKDAKQCRHWRLVHVNGLYCMFYLTENIKQLALCSLLCNVYKTIITPKKCQQELSTS